MTLRRLVVGGLFAAALALAVLRIWVFDLHLIASDSMANTLLPGDLVVAARGAEPTRGEIWVFDRQPGPEGAGRGDPLVKRVAAAPGDTISMLNGAVRVNGGLLPEPYVLPVQVADRGGSRFRWQRQHLAPGTDGAAYRPTLLTWGPLVVPADSYFMLGDNRGSSEDSRHRGFVHADRMLGRVRWRHFSYGVPAVAALPAERGVRWNRIGRVR